MQHLKYNIAAAMNDGEYRHPWEVIKNIGIAYQVATINDAGSHWLFLNCKNIPEKLSTYFNELNDEDIKYIKNNNLING